LVIIIDLLADIAVAAFAFGFGDKLNNINSYYLVLLFMVLLFKFLMFHFVKLVIVHELQLNQLIVTLSEGRINEAV
jgi:hypothetical protein